MSKEKLCACKQNNVKVSCGTCGMSFCNECDEATHKIPAFKDHKRYPYLGVESSKFCTLPDHEGNLLTLYCKDCKISICGGVCAHVEHKGHNFIPLSRAVVEIKEELAKLLGPYIQEEKELEARLKKKQEDLVLVRVVLEEIKVLLLHTDKENNFLTLVSESKIWKLHEKKIFEQRDVSWMETSDSYKGFRPLPSPDGETHLWACVSKSTTYSSQPKYDPPVGYEWASSDMWIPGVRQSGAEHVYFNLGGWSGYTYNGLVRTWFHFSDGKMFHSGWYPHSSSPVWTNSQSHDPFAGIIVYKAGTWDASTKKFKGQASNQASDKKKQKKKQKKKKAK